MTQEKFPFDENDKSDLNNSAREAQDQSFSSSGKQEEDDAIRKAVQVGRRARRTKPRPPSPLLKHADLIARLGNSGHFSMRDLVEAVKFRGGPEVHRLEMYRFVKKHIPSILILRARFRFNRNDSQSKKNSDE